MPQPFRFQTNFATKLAADIGAADTSFTLTTIPVGLTAGRYSFRIGNSQFTAEWLAADYAGSGTTFTNAERIGEGGNSPHAWTVGTSVANVLTGEAFNSVGRTTQAPFTARAHPELYVRSPALRVYIASNFN